MPDWATFICAAAVGYALGSVSFALWIARAKGVDLREVGSGNPGATNAGRAMGRPVGIAVYLLDAVKGWLPAWAVLRLVADGVVGADPATALPAGVVAGAGAFLGHVFPMWMGFRGGKGVATLSGALLALHPWTLLAGGITHLVVMALTRVMALASLAFGVALPVAAWLLDAPQAIVWFTACAGLFLFWTHRSNLRRMLRGDEDRVGDPVEKQP